MVFLVQQTMIKFIMFTNLLSQHQLKVQILDGSKEKQRKFLETVLALSAGVIQAAVATPVQLQGMAEGERTERTIPPMYQMALDILESVHWCVYIYNVYILYIYMLSFGAMERMTMDEKHDS